MWDASFPSGKANEVDCTRYQKVLEMRFGLADVARPAQPERTSALRNGSLNACSSLIARFPLGSRLLHTDALQDLVIGLHPQRHMARSLC